MTEVLVSRLKSFRDSTKGQLLSDGEISKLLSLLRPDGQRLIYTSDDWYNVTAQIYQFKFEPIYNVLSSQVWPNFNEVYRRLPIFELSKRRQRVDIAALRKQVEIAEGVFKCGKCGSEETLSKQKQVRGADEPMTLFIRCVHCGTQWTE